MIWNSWKLRPRSHSNGAAFVGKKEDLWRPSAQILSKDYKNQTSPLNRPLNPATFPPPSICQCDVMWSSSRRNWMKHSEWYQSTIWLVMQPGIIITRCLFIWTEENWSPTEPGFSQVFCFVTLSPDWTLDSLPLSPLACLVGDTWNSAILLFWQHWHYWMRTEFSWMKTSLFFPELLKLN